MSKKNAAPTPVEAPVVAETPVEAPVVQVEGRVTVRSKSGAMFINPFTNETIQGAPVEVTKDSWLDSQIEAGKIEIA